jgi:hypothetical protein
VTLVGWVGDVAAEIDRLVVTVFREAGRRVGDGFGFANAHPGLLVGVGSALAARPLPVASLAATYPYLPPALLDMLVENNVAEGVITLDAGVMSLTEPARREATRVLNAFVDVPEEFWATALLDEVEVLSSACVTHGCSLDVLFEPSAFAVQAPLTDQPSQPARVFRNLAALRYWRADAHRAAWSGAGLSVLEAHALNRLWDLDRGVVRIGQGEEKPGREGTAALEERGWVADGAINDEGRKHREAIEAETDARTEPIYEVLDAAGRERFLEALQQLPTG